MAELLYDENGRLLFTEEMKENYTILIPQMLPVHFKMMEKCLAKSGFNVETLTNDGREVVDAGLKYVHNDTCYPALLVIGQFMDALESGKYDLNKTALLITQTGGGCRASNYIHLLRKALTKAGLDYIPVVSLNLSGLDKNPGFKLSIKLLISMVFAMVYGDLIVLLANQVRPYELNPGDADRMIVKWEDQLVKQFDHLRNFSNMKFRKNLASITQDFAAIPVTRTKKVRVGIVGEIYIKYSPLGNNNLEDFLLAEGCEPVVPGLIDFIIFKINNRIVDIDVYGGNKWKQRLMLVLQHYVEKRQKELIAAVSKYPDFHAPETFEEISSRVDDYMGRANKMGEGWLLTAEMLDLVSNGIPNIVCAQPFGCLPNHIVGKGMIRAIRNNHPDANIVSIDYDPGATRINQENRIKLMLSTAKKKFAQG